MREYDPKAIEEKWKKAWEGSSYGRAEDDSSKKKSYILVEFPYPSGQGLHIGHPRSYVALDIVARKRRMQGENVLYPIGWDAFGLPTENYAIKTGRNPREVTAENIETFRGQIKNLGLSFDWSREIDTSDPSYYKWTQWIFLQLFKRGLAYKATTEINWCTSCKIGLANEEVVNGVCERCGGVVEKREREQWMLAITKYAQRLYDDLETVDFIEAVKAGQRNWIGPSEGAELDFAVSGSDEKIRVFTTRPDTLFGATYVVLAPEHALVEKLSAKITNYSEVEKYVAEAKRKTEMDRTAEQKEKTGVKLEGVAAVNPVNGEEVPIFIADYVLATYGTGAIMAVPAHDERDYDFAKKFDIPIREVISGGEVLPFEGVGALVNSGDFTGMASEEAKKKITEKVKGEWKTTYKLRDWVFSRQRYWGEPIPMIHCEKCGWVPVDEKDLPVVLPEVEKYEPTDTGDSPLAQMRDWVNTTCPSCGGVAKRETDVMPNWAGSSWYYLRYCDPHNNEAFADSDKLKYWIPVDWYNGGMEHTTLHLLYSRFWHKFLYDIKAVPTPEPYAKRTSHGLILGENGEKMSKSRGNVIDPNTVIAQVGADALRVYEMFMGPFDQSISWSTDGLVGVRRFIERVWKLQAKVTDATDADPAAYRTLHKTIKKVGEDIEGLKMNTAVSALMILTNTLEGLAEIPKIWYSQLVSILAPFAPFVAEELWETLGNDGSVREASWPEYDEKAFIEATARIAIQVNGKLRATIEVDSGASEEDVFKAAKDVESVKKWLPEGEPKRLVYVQNKLMNIVV